MPELMRNACKSGMFEFLKFTKRITLKCFVAMIAGIKSPLNILQQIIEKTKPEQMCKMMPKGIKMEGKRDADIKQKYIKVTAGKPRVAKSSPKAPQTACP